MFDNKPFEDIEKQAKHVIDLLNQEGARKKAIALKPFVPAEPSGSPFSLVGADSPEGQQPGRAAAADRIQVWWPTVPARGRVRADQ